MGLLAAALVSTSLLAAQGSDAPLPDARALPPVVPSEATGPAPRGSAEVVSRWTAAVRRADFERAAQLFADGARVQNGGGVELLNSPARKLVWNAALPCGATVSRIGGADGYAIVEFRLVERRGGDCGTGTGQPARAAIKVRAGRITGWYRLPLEGEPVRPSAPAQAV